jgi:methionyl-tRNA formyltransferase
LRTVYLGTSEFAATVLERLAGGPHRPALVITRPDRPSGRGRKLTAPPVALAAQRLDLPLAQPERIGDPEVQSTIEHAVRASGGDEQTQGGEVARGGEVAYGGEVARGGEPVLVVCAFGALIKEPLLSAYPLLNVHPSLLPRWRGAAPIERAIMAADAETGVSIMRLTAGLDSGPVCLAAAEAIAARETYGTLSARLARLGGELLVRVLDDCARGAPPVFVEQDDALATYAEKIAADDRMLDPEQPALALERQVRALHPHIGARLALRDGATLGVLRAEAQGVDPGIEAEAHGADPALQPAALADRGLEPGALADPALKPGVLADVDGQLLYGTRDGALRLLEVQPPGRRAMDAGAYLRGHDLRRP